MDKNLTYITRLNLLDNVGEIGEAFASINLNPTVTWAKFVLTDDLPNGNKQRIPKEEFDNIVKTGHYMPIKMTLTDITDHEGSIALGAITHLKALGNQIIGLAALWDKERPEDVKLIRENYKNGIPLELSWEMLYTDSSTDESTGVQDLKNCSLRATTLVKEPAYEGRTPIIAMAAVWDTAYKNNLPDSAFLYVEPGGKKDGEGKTVPRTLRHFPYKDSTGKIDLPHVRDAISRIPGSKIPENLKAGLQNRARKFLGNNQKQSGTEEVILEKEELEARVLELETQLEALKPLEVEVADLRSYKSGVETAKANDAKFASIKKKFSDAGIEKDQAYFDTNKEMLLRLEDTAIDFIVQEAAAFSSKLASAGKKIDLPDLNGTGSTDDKPLSIPELAEYLRSLK